MKINKWQGPAIGACSLIKKFLDDPRASNGEQTEKPITETSLIADRMAG